MRNAWIWIVIIVLVLVGAYLWWQSSQSAATGTSPIDVTTTITPPAAPTGTTTTDTESTASTTGATGTTAGPVTITYDGTSFSPSTVTIKKGDTVNWVYSGGQMWVASAPHPAHTGYDGTSRTTHCAPGYTADKPFDQCANTSSFSFTFDKVGTWPYHDHSNPSAFGKVVVTE